jgi:hypothetical protein
MAFSFVFEVTDVAALPASTGAQRSPGDILFYSKRPGSDNGRSHPESISFFVIESIRARFLLGGTGCRP